MRSLLTLFTLIAVAAPAAQAKHYGDGMRVNAAGPDSFVVDGVPTQTPTSHWCAAAEYARAELNAGFDQRMYVVGGQKRGESQVLISLSPKGTASEQERVREYSIRIDGANRKVNAGLADCRDLRRPSGR